MVGRRSNRRIGQEMPERAPYEDKYDPRPLYEVRGPAHLAVERAARQEAG